MFLHLSFKSKQKGNASQTVRMFNPAVETSSRFNRYLRKHYTALDADTVSDYEVDVIAFLSDNWP